MGFGFWVPVKISCSAPNFLTGSAFTWQALGHPSSKTRDERKDLAIRDKDAAVLKQLGPELLTPFWRRWLGRIFKKDLNPHD